MKISGTLDRPVVIEVDNDRNRNLMFHPLGRMIRGRLDFKRTAEKEAVRQVPLWPAPIPGQRLRLDPASGKAAIIEPLNFDEHEVTRDKIKKQGFRVAADEHIEGADVSTWLYWMRRAVKAGYARVVEGEFPAELPGKPRKRFHGPPEQESTTATLASAIALLAQNMARQADALEQLLAAKK